MIKWINFIIYVTSCEYGIWYINFIIYIELNLFKPPQTLLIELQLKRIYILDERVLYVE